VADYLVLVGCIGGLGIVGVSLWAPCTHEGNVAYPKGYTYFAEALLVVAPLALACGVGAKVGGGSGLAAGFLLWLTSGFVLLLVFISPIGGCG